MNPGYIFAIFSLHLIEIRPVFSEIKRADGQTHDLSLRVYFIPLYREVTKIKTHPHILEVGFPVL
jgi:hypothetical protein